MLVLSRKEGETIRIGESIVQVLKIKGSSIRLGIFAKSEVNISRGELPPLPLRPSETIDVGGDLGAEVRINVGEGVNGG